MLTTLHRFTPPTCTLEIRGKKSPLSRWTNQDLLKEFKFKLSFDDPRLSSDKQITITGDRFALEQLNTSVERYTQKNLYTSFISQADLTNNNNSQNNQPHLESKGLTNHELYFGNLQHDSTKNKMTLSTVQLFDLVTALEAYSSQIKALPELKQAQSKRAIPIWGGIAALAFVTAGVTTILLKTAPMQNIASSPESQSSDSIAQFDDVVPPDEPPASRKKAFQPKINKSISSAKRLPPPPAVDTPKPKPNIPDPADYPLSKVGRQSGLKQPVKQEKIRKEQVESIISPTPEIASETTPQLKSKTLLNQSPNIAKSDDSAADFSTESDVTDENNNTQDIPSKLSQSQEIKAYFEDRWQPPKDLKQSLEYRLYLNSDGSIKRVIPIGKASELYLDRTNIPVQGETFVSPLNKSQKSTIRLLLNPNGGIKTFAE